MQNELTLQDFSIRALDNDHPASPMPDTVQYTIQWGDFQHRQVLSHLEIERGGEKLESYLLKKMFLDMCVKAWDECDVSVQREKYSEIRKVA